MLSGTVVHQDAITELRSSNCELIPARASSDLSWIRIWSIVSRFCLSGPLLDEIWPRRSWMSDMMSLQAWNFSVMRLAQALVLFEAIVDELDILVYHYTSRFTTFDLRLTR
jgi:hypothetical protein